MLASMGDHPPSEDQAKHFEIRVEGHLDPSWSEYFGGLRMLHTQSGETILSGPIADQAALHGILAGIRDLNLPLIFLARVEGLQSPTSDQTSNDS